MAMMSLKENATASAGVQKDVAPEERVFLETPGFEPGPFPKLCRVQTERAATAPHPRSMLTATNLVRINQVDV